jgi:ABC-type transport system involved in multi-copper enzyme maturation permease subunit
MKDALVAIATHTFKEAIRDRILVLFVVFAVLLMGFSTILSWLTVGSELKIVTDVGLAALAFFGVLVAVFIGITLVHKEVEKRTIYAVLAKPVPRWLFLLGKYLGLMLTLAVVLGLMAIFYLVVVTWKGGTFPSHVLPAIWLTYLEVSVITSVAILFSCFTTPMLAAVFTLGAYLLGHLSWGLRELAAELGGAAGWLAIGIYYLLPDLETFNVRPQVVHDMALPRGYLLESLVYAAAYTAGMLVLAVILFRRRDLK